MVDFFVQNRKIVENQYVNCYYFTSECKLYYCKCLKITNLHHFLKIQNEKI